MGGWLAEIVIDNYRAILVGTVIHGSKISPDNPVVPVK
jgi:hypothetical protein